MDKLLRTQNIVQAAVFGALGIVALIAGCCGKTHQFAVAAICALMVAAAIVENRQEEKRAKSQVANNQ